MGLTQASACNCPDIPLAAESTPLAAGIKVTLPCTPRPHTPYVDAGGAFWSTTAGGDLPPANVPTCSSGELLTGIQGTLTPVLVYSVGITQSVDLTREAEATQGEVPRSSPASRGEAAAPLCPQPLHVHGSSEIDFDRALWVAAGGQPADCLNGTSVVLVDSNHAVEFIHRISNVTLERVDSAGAPLGPPPSLPRAWGGTPDDVPCAVAGGLLPYHGDLWEPVPGTAYPAGHEPDCRLNPMATLLANGRLRVTWSEREEDLVRHQGNTRTFPCG